MIFDSLCVNKNRNLILVIIVKGKVSELKSKLEAAVSFNSHKI